MTELDRSDEDYRALQMKGAAFAQRWLVPLLPSALSLMAVFDSYLEWHIPPSLWDPELMDGPTPATFRGWPLIRDDTVTEPVAKIGQPR